MKQFLNLEKSLLVFFFSNLFFSVNSLSKEDNCPFLADDNVWTFCHVGYNHLTGEQLSLWFEKYDIQGTRKIGDREYKEIWVTIAKEIGYTYDFENPQQPYVSYPVHEIGEPRYFMSLREENGRVYALVEEVNKLIGVPDSEISKPVPQMYPYEGDEYVVYDFLEKRSDKILPYIGDTVQFVVPNGLHVSDGVSWKECLNLFYREGNLVYQSSRFISDPFFPEEVDYRPFVEEGKRWTYDDYLSIRPDEYNHYYWYELKGDTVIAGQKCLKLYCENRNNRGEISFVGALYEVEKKVFFFSPGADEATLLYDFGCQVGDKLKIESYDATVSNIYTFMNGDREVRITELVLDLYPDEGPAVQWMEGIGGIMDLFSMINFPGNYSNIRSCEVNGEILYQYIQPKLTEEGYHEMGIEGKTWNYIHHYEDEDGIHEEPYRYVVKGDTVIGRTICKKVYYQDETKESFAYTLLESGREVLLMNPGGKNWMSPYMFGRDDIGRVFDWTSEYGRGRVYWMLNSVDTISVRGTDFRRFTFLQKTIEGGKEGMLSHIDDDDDVWHEIWIEGVGSQMTGLLPPIHEEPPISNDYTRFVSCYENGICIFTADDFTSSIRNDAAKDQSHPSQLSALFDLSGRPLSAPPAKGIFIQDGQKVVR